MSLEKKATEVGRYNGRMTPFVILSCVVAAMGGVIFGYDLGISGGVSLMVPFLKKFFPKILEKMMDSRVSNYCVYDSQLLTAFTSSLYIAGLLASFPASWVTQSFGRKPSIVAGGALFFMGAVLGGLAVDIYMLIVGRIMLGIGVAFTNQSAPLYLSEMAPPHFRGAINNGFDLFLSIGVFAANLINYGSQKISGGWGWRVSLGAAVIPATFLTIGSLFLPETPNSFLQRGGDLQTATKMLQRIRGTDDVHGELHDLITAATEKNTTHPLKKILQKKYRPQLVMAIAIPFFQQVTGINVMTFYAPIIFRTIGFGESASLMSTVVTGTAGTSFTVLAMVMVDKSGRRPLFFTGGALMIGSHIVVGGILGSQLDEGSVMGRGYAYIVLIFTCVYIAGFTLSWGPLGWLVPSEIFPLEIRSAGQSIVVAVSFLFTFLFAQIFLTLLCHLEYGTFFFFAGWVAVMTGFVYMFLPETKNVPIEQMEQIWREHWFWKGVVVGDNVEE